MVLAALHALRRRRQQGDSSGDTPKWLSRLDRTNWLLAVVVGAVMLTYSLTIAAAAEILKANVSTQDDVIAFVVFAVASIATIVAPVGVALLAPDRAERWLAAWRRWLLGNSRLIGLVAVIVTGVVVRTWRVTISEKTTKGMVEKMSSVASSPWIAVLAAGATLANPGGFIPLALKAISETNPSTAGYATLWLVFTLVSLLPLGVAIVLLLVSPGRAERLLGASRTWLEGHLRLIASVIILLLALSLLRNGISGLAG